MNQGFREVAKQRVILRESGKALQQFMELGLNLRWRFPWGEDSEGK
jgi:hypothetical protein